MKEKTWFCGELVIRTAQRRPVVKLNYQPDVWFLSLSKNLTLNRPKNVKFSNFLPRRSFTAIQNFKPRFQPGYDVNKIFVEIISIWSCSKCEFRIHFTEQTLKVATSARCQRSNPVKRLISNHFLLNNSGPFIGNLFSASVYKPDAKEATTTRCQGNNPVMWRNIRL